MEKSLIQGRAGKVASMNTAPVWITYSAALLTPVLAAFGAYIAWRQAQTAREKLKLELFERRYPVYLATFDAVRHVVVKSYLPEVEKQAFLQGTRGARWLFNPAVHNYIDQVWEMVLEIDNVNSLIDQHGAEINDEYRHLRALRTKHLTWFVDQITNRRVDGEFKDFLQLAN